MVLFCKKTASLRGWRACGLFLYIGDLTLQALSVSSNNVLVPVEGLLAVTLQCTCVVVVAVHINESVTLAELCRRCADQVDTAPCGVTHDLNAVLQRLAYL